MAMKHKPREGRAGKCGVQDCKEQGHKSISTKKVKSALTDLSLREGGGKRVQLCKKHYKEFKKKTKKERELDRLGWE
jgi:hypothetical protein